MGSQLGECDRSARTQMLKRLAVQTIITAEWRVRVRCPVIIAAPNCRQQLRGAAKVCEDMRVGVEYQREQQRNQDTGKRRLF
jgi:hypothetical protein